LFPRGTQLYTLDFWCDIQLVSNAQTLVFRACHPLGNHPTLPENGREVQLTLRAGRPPATAELRTVERTAPQAPNTPPDITTQTAPPPETGQVITAIITDTPAAAAEQAALAAAQHIQAALSESVLQINLPVSEDLILQDPAQPPASSTANTLSTQDIAAVIAALSVTPSPTAPATEEQAPQPVTTQPALSPFSAFLSVLEDNVFDQAPPPQNTAQNLQHLNGQVFQFTVTATENVAIPQQTQPVSQTAEPRAPLTENTVIAQAVSQSPSGLTIVSVQSSSVPQLQPETQLILQTPVSIENGGLIQFTATPLSPEQFIQQLQSPVASPSSAAQTAQQISGFQPLFSLTWPALQEALHISNNTAIPAIATALRNTIPSPASPSRLIPTAMFFLAALRMGSIENWLGEKTLDTLRQAGRRDLITKLSGDFSNMRQAQDTLSGDWRGVSIPLLNQEDIEMMQLYSRQQHEDDNPNPDDDNDKTTRFLLNLKLSQLGSLQLDGLLRHKKTLDVFLRTETPLPADTKQQLLQAFHTGLEQANLENGQMIFQSTEKHWVDVTQKNPVHGTEINV